MTAIDGGHGNLGLPDGEGVTVRLFYDLLSPKSFSSQD